MARSNAQRRAAARARIILIFIAAWCVLPSAAGAVADHRPGPADESAPSGLVVVIENKPHMDRLDLRALKNPYIRGVAFQIHWADIEPVQGKPDWSKLDQLFAAAESSKKWVHLLVFPGFFSPSWALHGAQTQSFAVQYGPGSGTVMNLPMPWDKVYLDHWFDFLKELSQRYGKTPAFKLIAAAGPTSVSAEFTLPGSPRDLKTWQDHSYRPSKFIVAWREVFRAYAADFPDQYVSLSLGRGVNINERGRIDAREYLRTRQAIVDEGMRLLGSRFALQLSDVHAGLGPRNRNSEAEDQFVIGYNGRIITGFQMRTSAEHDSAVMGAEGDPPSALKKSISLATEPNSDGRRISYLEIYQPDVLADEMQEVLRYGASMVAR